MADTAFHIQRDDEVNCLRMLDIILKIYFIFDRSSYEYVDNVYIKQRKLIDHWDSNTTSLGLYTASSAMQAHTTHISEVKSQRH